MHPDLDKKLCETYPKIFRDRNADMRTTCMCWGFECSDGWYSIIDALCSSIQSICDKEGFQVIAVQVKEKFGGLRFYINHGTDDIYKLINEAEEKSINTCETCGNPGRVRGKGWFYCACNQHAEPEDKDQGLPSESECTNDQESSQPSD